MENEYIKVSPAFSKGCGVEGQRPRRLRRGEIPKANSPNKVKAKRTKAPVPTAPHTKKSESNKQSITTKAVKPNKVCGAAVKNP